MRQLRWLATGLLVLVSGLLVAPAQAAAAPIAPYDAFTLDGPRWNFSFDPTNTSIALTMRGAEGVDFSADSAAHNFHALIAAPTGQTLSVGTFPTLRFADATHAGLDVSGDGVGCNESTGSMTVHEVTRNAVTHDVTALAVTYDAASCPGVKGEIRWHSSVGYTAVVGSPRSLGFGNVDLGATASAQTVAFTGGGSSAVNLGTASVTGATPGAFSITADSCSNGSLAYGQTCAVSVTAHPTAAGIQSALLTIPDNTTAGQRSIPLNVNGVVGAQGTYYPLSPVRLLDTRTGNGVPQAAPLGQGGVIHLQVTNRGNVPTSGVSAVVLNVTATAPTGFSFLTVYPTGVSRPTASNLNFPPGWTGANSVTVPVGAGGQVDIYNNAGSVHVIADVVGFYAADDSVLPSRGLGGQYLPLNPSRVLDTRDPSFGGQLPSGFVVTLTLDFGIRSNQHVRAFAVNVTAVDPGASGFLTAWNGVDALPDTSTLNFTPHTIVPNLAVVPIAPCPIDPSCAGMPSIGIFNGSGAGVHVVVDIFGFYDDSFFGDGLRFHPLTPTRIVDTRVGQGAPQALGPNATATVTAPSAVAGADTHALATNVTAVNASSATFLTVWPAGISGVDRPLVSNLNPVAGQTIPNAVFAEIGPTKQFNIFNNAGRVDVVVDVSGAFTALPSQATQRPSASAVTNRPPTFRVVPRWRYLRH